MSINALASDGQDVVIGNGSIRFPLKFALLGWLIISIILLGMVNAFGTFFWVLGFSGCLILLHSAFYSEERTGNVTNTLQGMEEAS